MPDKILNNTNISRDIFFMNLSHEVRTPLNLIHSTVQLLEKYTNNNTDNKSIKKYLETIKKNNYRLYKILDNLIYYLQINNNFHQYSPQNNDIIHMVKNITESCSHYSKEQNKKMTFTSNLKEKIIAYDSYYMKKILLNLLSNAIKFTKEGDKIKVTVYEESKEICISVKDTGIGIPKEKQDTIFDTFYQVDRTLRRENEGSGMGLTIVKELVKLHNGKINLKSKVGKGTEFILKLPILILPQTQDKEKTEIAIQQNMLNMADVELSDIYI